MCVLEVRDLQKVRSGSQRLDPAHLLHQLLRVVTRLQCINSPTQSAQSVHGGCRLPLNLHLHAGLY